MQAIYRIPQYRAHVLFDRQERLRQMSYGGAVKLGDIKPGEDAFATLAACKELERKFSESFDEASIFIARSVPMCDGDIYA